MENKPPHASEAFFDGELVFFVDPPHEVTEEERNRPRYGRPVRRPDDEAAPPPQTEPRPGGPA
jgi:hypothetical protein